MEFGLVADTYRNKVLHLVLSPRLELLALVHETNDEIGKRQTGTLRHETTVRFLYT